MNVQYQLQGMIALECHQSFNQIIDKTDASKLVETISRDLTAILSMTKENVSLACSVACYPVEQILQPKWPIHSTLNQYASAAMQGEQQQHKVLSIGADHGQMPEGLQPHHSSQPLMLIPFILYTNSETIAQAFEQDLMNKGMISPPTYQALSEITGLTVQHANYLSNIDLLAMMHNHYQQLGQDACWQIIEHAVLQSQSKTMSQSKQHNYFYLHDHLVFSPMFSMHHFVTFFDGTADQYIDWIIQQRTAMAAFQVHGLELHLFQPTHWPLNEDKICLGAFEQNRLTGSFWIDNSSDLENKREANLTYVKSQQAGILAVRVEHSDTNSRQYYYPLRPEGIKAIEAHIKQQFPVIAGEQVHILETHCNWPP